LSFTYENLAITGGNPRFGLRVFRTDRRGRSVYTFDSTVTGLMPRLTWALGERGQASVYVLYSVGEITNAALGTSPLILADVGRQRSTTVGGELDLRFRGGDGLRKDTRLGLELGYGSTSRDHEFLRYAARLAALHALQDGAVVLRCQFRLGGIKTVKGRSAIGDRFMLGDASLRGFAFGGFGPRDLGATRQPALGGNQYAVMRLDTQFPHAFGGRRRALFRGCSWMRAACGGVMMSSAQLGRLMIVPACAPPLA